MNASLIICLVAGVMVHQPVGLKPATKMAAPANAAAAETGPYKVIKTFEIGGEGRWDYLYVDPATNHLFVPRSSHVMVIDANTGAVLGDIPDTKGVHGVAIAPEFGKGFTSNGGGNTVTVFDLKTFKVLETVKTGENPDAILYDPATKQVFAFNGKSHDATVINAESLAVVGTIPVGGKPEYAASDEKGKVFVNVEDTSELLKIDAKTMKVEQRIALSPASEPSGLAIDPVHHYLFSVCGNEMMAVVDGESGKVLATPAIGKRVDGAGFDPSGFAISSNGDGTITVVATSDKSFPVVQTLKTAAGARTIAVDPKSHRMYLPTAEFEAPAAGDKAPERRPKMKANSFKIVVVGPA